LELNTAESQLTNTPIVFRNRKRIKTTAIPDATPIHNALMSELFIFSAPLLT
jgi:hypothetical protein